MGGDSTIGVSAREPSERTYRYTAFPSLQARAVDPEHTTTNETPATHVFGLPEGLGKDALVLSWALLLRGYTGVDAAVFVVNGTDTCVTFADGRITDVAGRVEQEPEAGAAGGKTAVYFSREPSAELAPPVYLCADIGPLHASIVMPTTIVSPQHVPEVASQLLHILSTMPSACSRPLSPGLDAPGRQARNPLALSILNPEPIKHDGPNRLHELVSKHSNADPERPAVEFLDARGNVEVLSYDELHDRSDRLARRIAAEFGQSADHHNVPVLLPQSTRLYVAILAVLKAGAAFVPLNLDAPEERVRFVVNDVGAAAVVTDTSFRDRFEWEGAPSVILLDGTDAWGSGEEAQLLPRDISPSQPAYIMYTSGSTGAPKGVVISHSAASQSLLAHDEHIPTFERFLQFAAPTFDVSVFEMFFPLLRGSTLVGCDRGTLLSDLPGAINRMCVDAAELTPTVAGSMLGPRRNCPGLRVLLTIGEMLTRQVVGEYGDGVLHGMYGPTEAAIHCTLASPFAKDARVGDVGVPLETVSAFVVSPAASRGTRADVEVLPVGWIGELAVGGHQLADGYLRRPEQTREAFVDSPRWGRLYRTGDKARMLPSGRVECLGRVSAGQVKLRGQRVELGEVEEVALRTRGVKAAAASVVENSLVLYAAADSDVDKAAIKKMCGKWLPGFMVPSDIVVYQDLPKLPSGKADRKCMDKDYIERILEPDGDEQYSGEEERAVARVIEDILRLRPSREGSLAALGLDSILAIKLVSALRKEGLQVEVTDVLQADAVAGIAAAVTSTMEQPPPESGVARERFTRARELVQQAVPGHLWAEIEDVIPCTQLQEATLLETARDSSAYCNWILLELPTGVDACHAETAVENLIQANPMLRTGFMHFDTGFVQVVWKGTQNGQFQQSQTVEPSWNLSLDDLLRPPFSVEFADDRGRPRLSVRIHHALYDGWSWEHILSDLEDFLAGRQPRVPRKSYREVVKWELGRPESAREAARTFWRNQLEGAGNTKLPSFHGHDDASPGTSIESRGLAVSRADFEAAARRSGVSPHVLVQVAWAYLLSLVVPCEDVVFGTVVSGRTIQLPGIVDIVGPTISTLPVRVRIRADETAEVVLRTVHKFNRAMLDYPEVGLREIRKACQGAGGFDSLLVWQQTLKDTAAVPDGEIQQIDRRDRLEFALLLEIEPRADSIDLRATYKNETLPQAQASLILRQLDELVSSIVQNPARNLVSLLADVDAGVLSVENADAPRAPASPSRTLATVFEDSAARSPNAVAVEFACDIVDGRIESKTISYCRLNSDANQLARHLLRLGVCQDDLVAVWMEKSIICYTSILAAVKAGAGYLPLTTEIPRERAKQILCNSEAKILLTTRDIAETLDTINGLAVVIVDDMDVGHYGAGNIEMNRRADKLGYAVFTSGSTGVPKGVLVEHAQAVANIDFLAELYPANERHRMLQFCNIAFDVSVFEIFFAWRKGMCLCSATKDVFLRDLETAINALGATHLSMTPTVAALVKPDNVPNVRFLVTSGEAVTRRVFNNWAGRGLWQGYGPSETTNICTVKPRVRPVDHINNIGPPFANTSALVVIPDVEPLTIVPRGAIGELCFGGTQVARGYLKMPELTAKKFVAHPIYGRVYRSGDLGRLLPNGDIEFVGRQDDQVKVRGNRIELGEINSVLLRSAHVTDARTLQVIGKPGAGAESSRLVSFVALNKWKAEEFGVFYNVGRLQSTIDTIFDSLNAVLPSYMVPGVIVPVSKIPMTDQSKADSGLLVKTFLEMAGTSSEPRSSEASRFQDTSHWTRVERNVAAVVAEVAQVPVSEIGTNTSIFGLGIDSLSAIQVSSRINSAGFPRLDVSQIMRNSTIAGLAALLQPDNVERRPASPARSNALRQFSDAVSAEVIGRLQLARAAVVKILPCTPLQEAMLGLKKGSDPSMYYNHTILQLNADPRRLRNAWAEMLSRNEIMRTCFCVTSHPKHAFAQVVLEKHDLIWDEVEVPNEGSLNSLVDSHLLALPPNMDTSRPPYRFRLFSSPAKSVLVMSFHHSLYDGYAMELLLHDVRRIYSGMDLPSRELFDPYLEYLENIDLKAADAFWKDTLTGLEPSEFPDLTGKSSDYRKQLTGMTQRSYVSSRTLDAIKQGCRDLGSSLLALGHTAWARLLSAYTGDTDLCFGNVVSGRTVPVQGVEGIIAPCFNTVPIRARIPPKSTNRSILDQMQHFNAELLPFQLTSLRRIKAALNTEGQGLFDTLFILQHKIPVDGTLQELWDEIDDRGEMDFSIVIELVPRRDSNTLAWVVHFRRNIILEEHADIILRQLDATLLSTIDNVEGLASDFSALDPRLAAISNAEPVVLDGNDSGLLHSEFERNAEEIPERIALEFMDASGDVKAWTFAELNRLANQVAHVLCSLEVARDDAIPICLEKSPSFYIAVLAVLKAGCAFTPIDPSLPAQRKRFMIHELRAKIVVGSKTTAKDLGLAPAIHLVEMDTKAFSNMPVENPHVVDLNPACLAYRIYTSGSTGQPKAVSLEHRSAVQTFRTSRSIIPWNDSSRLLQFAATTFDMCYYDCFMAWSYGFTLCAAARSHVLGNLQATIKRLRVSMLDLTPTVAATLTAQDLPDVEVLYCIGEAMSQQLVSDWQGRCLNSYGPTEAAMCCTITEVDPDIKAANIGRPFRTASFYVLALEGSHVLPVFGSGELCIGGPQLAREYHNNPELGKLRYIEFGGKKLYRTGDIVRQLGDCTFEFIGRADDQVKIRGLRVELNEITVIIKNAHPLIKDATTIVLRHKAESKKQLVSFLACEYQKQHGTATTVIKKSSFTEGLTSAARDAAQALLPRYMIPGVILVVEHIPLSVAGKVDKRALTSVFQDQDIKEFTKTPTAQATWSDDELKIRSVLSAISLAPEENIGRDTTIYELGLDSISASQVAMQLKTSQLPISVLDILERPSIEQLSSLLRPEDEGYTNCDVKTSSFVSDFHTKFLPVVMSEAGLDPKSIAGIYPCTPSQEGMLSQFLRSDGRLYYNSTLLELPADAEIKRLHDAWENTMGALEVLRSGFVGIDDSDQRHSFAMVTYSPEASRLPWSVTDSARDRKLRVANEKKALASRALQALHLPPWNVTVFLGGSGSTWMLFSGHHALYDATALQMILQDVASRYLGRKPPERARFDGVLYEICRHTMDSAVIEEDRKFWLEQLQGSSISKLPNLCPLRDHSTGYHAEVLQSTWDLSTIETACQNLGISIQSVGQAAWAKVLSAYMGEAVVTLGKVFSGRIGLDAQSVAFPCIVTIPSVCHVKGTNHELAFDIQQSNSRALKHQHTPLKSIQRWLSHPEESVFDSIFVYQKMDSGREALPWAIVEEEAAADYTFSLEVEPTPNNRLLLRATGRDRHIPRQQTALLLRQFDAAMVDILKCPQSPAALFASLPRDLLSLTPASVDEIPCAVKLLHKFVEEHARLCPQKTAFEFATAIDGDRVQKQSWSYAQLDGEGNKVANFLLANGAKTGQRIVVCFEKCPEASFAMLGVLKAGCGFVGLDYNAPSDRKAFIIEDCKAPFVLTMDKYAAEMRSFAKARVISMESDKEIMTASIVVHDINDLTPDHLCYCLYTSGTTGTPKGCELTHENAVQAMLAFQRLFSGHWDDRSKFLQFAAFHFDVGVLEQYWSWSVGICVTSAPRDLIFQDLANTINRLQITHLDLTPSLAALLDPADVPSLWKGVFITGGEALRQDILDKWGSIGCIYNGYGPTEVTIGCTMYPRVPASGRPSNIGPQFDNVGSYVFVPGTEELVPRGAIGELCVSGKLVGRGYLNQPGLTEEKFPVLKSYNERIYRTGDIVRILYDGTFDFAGRADDQVKLRGQRLEIGEINEVIKKADHRVHAVTTLVLRHPKQQKDQLVSFVVTDANSLGTDSAPALVDNSGNGGLVSALADACKRMLPAYMIPTHFLPISRMPLSINNKVDNKVLKVLYGDTSLEVLQRLARREDWEGQWSEAEERLRSVLVEMTGLEMSEITRFSTIFELGLDSVSVVGLVRRLKKCGFVAASASIVMKSPVLSQLASDLSAGGAENAAQENGRLEAARQYIAAFANKNAFEISRQLDIDPDRIVAIFPCSSLQEGIIARFLDADEPLYFNSFPLQLHTSVDVPLLRDAWQTVMNATDILRTCFCQTAERYAQIVLKDTELRWEDVVLDHENIEEMMRDAVRDYAARNSELHEPPIFIQLVRTPSRTVLVLNIFHALYDGNSLPIIFRDVQAAYHGKFHARPVQFGDMLPHIFTLDSTAAQTFWKETLESSSPALFPRLVKAPSADDHVIQTKLNLYDAQLETLCRKAGCTAQSLFQAVWACVLASYVGPQVTFGIVVSGRSLALDHVEDIIGPAFNTIPCSFDLSNTQTWTELLKTSYRYVMESIPFHHTPLRLIRKWLRRSAQSPLFDTLFVYQVESAGSQDTPSLWKALEGPTIADYPLSLEIAQNRTGDITMTAAAKGCVLDRNHVIEILHQMENQVQELCGGLDRKPQPSSLSPTKSLADGIANGYDHANGQPGFVWDRWAIQLKKMIAELAEVDESEIDEDSSILELGLDSIEAIKLSSRLRRHQIVLSVSTIMRNPTIQQMQRHLQSGSQKKIGPSPSEYLKKFADSTRRCIGRAQRWVNDDAEAIYPTTPLQEAMIAETLASDYDLYFNHDILELNDGVDPERLWRAWGTVVAQNEILRTSFFSTRDIGMDSKHSYGQIVRRDLPVDWKEVVASSAENPLSKVKHVVKRLRRGVDMLRSPPLYLTLIRGSKLNILVLSISHALYDGWSMGLLHRDVHDAYFRPGGAIPRRPSPSNLLENVFSVDPAESKRYWKQVLHRCTVSSFPPLPQSKTATDMPKTHRCERMSHLLAPEVHMFCKSVGATLQTLGQMIWGLTLAHFLGETDVVFGTVLSGRDFESAEEIMFPAMNTVPVRAMLHGTYRELLSYMQDQSSLTLNHQTAPLREIQKLVGTSGRRLFDTLFIYQNAQFPEVVHDKLWTSVGGMSDVEYTVCVELERAEDKLVWRDACKSTSMDDSQAAELLERLDSLLSHVIGYLDHPAVTCVDDGLAIGNMLTVPHANRQSFNGVRVDLVQLVEYVKQVHRGIADCAVIGASSGEQDALVFFVTGADDIMEIIDSTRHCLPSWAFPSYVLPVAELPRQSDGTIDRTQLQKTFSKLTAEQCRQYSTAQKSGAWSALERQIRRVLAEVAHVPEDEIEHTQTIFHLGLDSISAIKFAGDLRKAGISMSVTQILKAGTVERMAGAVRSSENDARVSQASELDNNAVLEKALADIDIRSCLREICGDVEIVLPVTAGQLYFLSCWENSGEKLFLPTFTFKTPWVDRRMIESAWRTLVQEEPILRTVFRGTGRVEMPFVQAVLRETSPQFTWYEASQSDPALMSFVKAREQAKNADLTMPPARICAVTMPSETIIYLTIHHALYDGVSLPLLLAKFEALMDQAPDELSSAPSSSFSRFIAFAHSQPTSAQRMFWSSYLASARSTLVPQLHPGSPTTQRGIYFCPGALTDIRCVSLRCRQAGVSVQALFLAAFARVYAHHFNRNREPAHGSSDVVMGVYLANRQVPVEDIDTTAAPTLNIVPLHARGAGDDALPLLKLAGNVQADLIRVSEPQNAVVDLQRIRSWSGIAVDCFFNFLKLPGEDSAAEARSMEEIDIGDGSGFDLGPELGTGESVLAVPDITTNLDVEVAVRGKRVDVGAFSTARYLDDSDLKDAVDWMCELVRRG